MGNGLTRSEISVTLRLYIVPSPYLLYTVLSHSSLAWSNVGESVSASSATLLLITAQAAASLRPFSTSTQNKMITNEQRHRAKRKGNPIQLLPDPSMIAWITSGPIRDDATVESPKSPKNYTIAWEGHHDENSYMLTHHVLITGWDEFSHHCLGKSIERCLEKAENDIVRPTQKLGDRFWN